MGVLWIWLRFFRPDGKSQRGGMSRASGQVIFPYNSYNFQGGQTFSIFYLQTNKKNSLKYHFKKSFKPSLVPPPPNKSTLIYFILSSNNSSHQITFFPPLEFNYLTLFSYPIKYVFF